MSITSTRKPFSSSLFIANDALARAAGVEHLKSQPVTTSIANNPDTYGVDLLYGSEGNASGALEVEVKKVWVGPNFPYPSIQIPQRKAKFFSTGSDYLLTNSDASAYLVLDGATILASPLKEVPNKYVKSGELFYQVPAEKARYYTFQQPLVTTYSVCCPQMNLTRNEANEWSCGSCSLVQTANIQKGN